MEPDQFCTPEKVLPFRRGSPGLRFFGPNRNTTQPNNVGTPNTPKSLRTKSNTFHLFPFKNTPTTPVRFPKVINPFESTLAERLHLPLICSPSLFQHPTNSTQNNSGQFEWTIEEVSSLGPANVVAHETQFEAITDPDLEARAQAAISSFFQEHPIVPSPIDCPLRNQKIILPPEISSENCSVRPGRRIRDGAAQTILSFPVNLPPEVEKVLSEYFTYNENQQQSPTRYIDCDNSASFEEEGQQPAGAADTSHRRKLFHTNDDDVNVTMEKRSTIEDVEVKRLEHISRSLSPPPLSPDLANNLILINSESSLSNTSFGQLSPISKDGSPCKSVKFYNNDSRGYLSEEKKGTNTLTVDGSSSLLRTSSSNSLYRSTPDIFLDGKKNNSVVQMSIDSSFNGHIERLNMYSPRINKSKHDLEDSVVHKAFSEGDMLHPTCSNKDEENEMQISRFLPKSPNTSGSHSSNSHHANTPVRKRRSANRKNLSRSFCLEPSDDEDDLDGNNTSSNFPKDLLNNDEKRKNHLLLDIPSNISKANFITTDVTKNHQNLPSENLTGQQSLLHKTDSGFTEMTSSQEEFSKFLSHMPITRTDSKEEPIASPLIDISMNDGDVSMMVCCSTPSCKS